MLSVRSFSYLIILAGSVNYDIKSMHHLNNSISMMQNLNSALNTATTITSSCREFFQNRDFKLYFQLAGASAATMAFIKFSESPKVMCGAIAILGMSNLYLYNKLNSLEQKHTTLETTVNKVSDDVDEMKESTNKTLENQKKCYKVSKSNEDRINKLHDDVKVVNRNTIKTSSSFIYLWLMHIATFYQVQKFHKKTESLENSINTNKDEIISTIKTNTQLLLIELAKKNPNCSTLVVSQQPNGALQQQNACIAHIEQKVTTLNPTKIPGVIGSSGSASEFTGNAMSKGFSFKPKFNTPSSSSNALLTPPAPKDKPNVSSPSQNLFTQHKANLLFNSVITTSNSENGSDL